MADKNFNYPFLEGWSTDDIVKASRVYDAVANAYEVGVERDELLAAYRDFKTVVPSKSEEKQLDREFSQASDYSIYRVMQAARSTERPRLKMDV